jgi:hypothetical protein
VYVHDSLRAVIEDLAGDAAEVREGGPEGDKIL